ncbi:DEAD/DEAH box helicase [Alkalilacustris brevis]|uniref:preprotein translocase subunit SecA n=1 Tax=Alkalilacustris brevis TaxID=2026338 RepID=UPI000E0D5BC1|nr:DEAD/DEAH box helicase [Alkalilacustris brevis]
MARVSDIPPPRTGLALNAAEIAHGERSLIDIARQRWREQCNRRLHARRVLRGIHRERAALSDLPEAELRQRARALPARLRKAALEDVDLAECFALVDAVLKRVFGFHYHDNQLLAGFHLANGNFVELATGEGKTVTAILPAALHALAGTPIHVVTVNDYLAARDAEEVAPVLGMLGLEVGTVVNGMNPKERRAAYGCDVTYCTNKELVFDYLKDRIKLQESGSFAERVKSSFQQDRRMVTELGFVIIDEADSVLIDDANIPLILTREESSALSRHFVEQAIDLVDRMDPSVWEYVSRSESYYLNPRFLKTLIDDISDPAPEWQSFALAEEVLMQAKTAREKFRRDVHYFVEEDKIVLIDPQTGRPTPDRSLPWGLHQVLEVREGLEVSPNRRTIAKLSFQSYFRKYHKICGMSGTLHEVRGELRKVYRAASVHVPTHRPVRNFCQHDRIFVTSAQRDAWVAERTAAMQAAGRAVLIGVNTVEASDAISAALHRKGLEHQVLNAKHLEQEAEIVKQAGQIDAISVVTNMAGRGTDIKLNPEVRAAGGLHVIIAEVLPSARLERQLFGRAGRQGDPGSHDFAHALDERPLDEAMTALVRQGLVALARTAPGLADRVFRVWLRLYQRNRERQKARVRKQLFKADMERDEVFLFSRLR